MESTTGHPVEARKEASPARGITDFIREQWILLFAILMGLYVGLPFLAPILYHLGLNSPAGLIQTIYSTQCHQLPDRSFFLFGPQFTYSLLQIQAAFQNTTNPAILRQFVGNAEMGWKVAWSDRMVAMYTSLWLFGLLWWFFRRNSKPISLVGLVLYWLPMAIDGGTHFISDVMSGIGSGFRYDNAWLAVLTAHRFAQSFYDGNGIGSFNSDMRILTGILFGLGAVLYIFPMIQASARQEP